jgi:protein NRD1
MANVEQLDPLLQSLQALKPPGASKGKITAITNLCVGNVQVNCSKICIFSIINSLILQSESAITQKLYRHLKRTPGTHKLGVLYVVDSVTRQWIEKARQSSQELSGGAAPEGTFAAGVHRITELLPSLINDTVQNAPADHKVCQGTCKSGLARPIQHDL